MDGNEMRKEKSKQSFFDRTKEKIKNGSKVVVDKTKAAGKTLYDNKEKIILGVGSTVLLIKTVKEGTDAIGLTNRTKYERTLNQRRTQYYDPHSRRYFELRRPLRNYEILEIEERSADGEPVGHILDDMGLLKRGW